MKRFLLCLLLMLLTLPAARAEFTGCVREDQPMLAITVAEIGEPDEEAERSHTLKASITASDGSLNQEISWQSNETPRIDRAATQVMLTDYNFDGYADLQLLTAAGARNVFYTVALWNPEAGRFDPVLTDAGAQLEMCNPVFYPEQQLILSSVADGYAYRTETFYALEGPRFLTRWAVWDICDAGKGRIGESLTLYGTGISRLWEQTYPESWYYGEDSGGAWRDRDEAVHRLLLEGGLTHPRWMQVANVEWVNLRALDRKDSDSLARLTRGTDVQVLREGCGADEGWVLVWVDGHDVSAFGTSAGIPLDDGVGGLTGYIWHSYLEPTSLQVANVDWVNVREAPDKQSAAIAKLDAGTRVYRCGRGMKETEGWVPVSGFLPDGSSFAGYIWHSYLEESEY